MQAKMEETDFNKAEKIFLNVLTKLTMAMVKVYGIFDESLIVITICPSNKEIFINIDVAIQVQVQESMKNESNEDQIEVPLKIDDYHFSFQFIVAAIEDHLINIMLGYNWLETLGTFSSIQKTSALLSFKRRRK